MKLTGSVITTFRCNAHCHMCNIWKYPTTKEEELNPQIMAKLPNNMYRINITGGEPMQREDIDEIVEVLYSKTKVLEISTNGFYTDRVVKIAQRHPDVLIRVSLEGLPSYNDRLRGTRDGFDHALRTILELKKVKARNIGFSIVICDKNAHELPYLYDLCSSMGIELGNAIMHNSWYFHKYDNVVEDKLIAVDAEKKYIQALLSSHRGNIAGRAKDWLRAYFNRNVLRMLSGEQGFRPSCVAGTDMFFLDPWGNVLPCNGTNESWIMGNLIEQTFDEIWNSQRAREVREQVKRCTKTCCFVSTERYEMVRRPWLPVIWILRNKIRLWTGKEVVF